MPAESRRTTFAPLLAALAKFDEIFAVLDDDDAAKMKRVFDWAPTEGRDKDISEGLRDAAQSGQLSDADIEKKIAEMKPPAPPATSRPPTRCAPNSPPLASWWKSRKTAFAGAESDSRWQSSQVLS